MPEGKPAKPYDILVVGAGLFGSTFARIAADNGKRVLVIERRPHIGGNCYTEEQQGIHIHRYGAHIFHTSNEVVWRFVNRYASFNQYINSPIALSHGEVFSLPFNMHTFSKLWGVRTPSEAETVLAEQREEPPHGEPENLEEQALSLVGRDVYERLIRGYTLKQWQRDPKQLPAEIIKRIPVRYTYNANYFNDRYQGIPNGGDTSLFRSLLQGLEVKTSVDFHKQKPSWMEQADLVVYTGQIDELFDYCHGELEYRTLQFDDTWHEQDNVQGNAVVNYCDASVPHTRTIEHKHFDPGNPNSSTSVVTTETPISWKKGLTPYYPINDGNNTAIYSRYVEQAAATPNLVLGGRLAEYRYFDMHAAIGSAILKAQAMGLTVNP